MWKEDSSYDFCYKEEPPTPTSYIIGEKNTSIVIDWTESLIIKKLFNTDVVENLADLKNRLSRKKQVVPDLTEYFNNN